MSTPQQIGGYTYRQQIASARQASATARRYVERILDEQPGPALAAVYLARIGLALGQITETFGELERIGRNARAHRGTEQSNGT
jgi:hypothetical protein